MSASRWTVNVPDRAPMYFDKTLTPAEVQSALVSTGHSSVATAEIVINGDTLSFRRPSGGSKGV